MLGLETHKRRARDYRGPAPGSVGIVARNPSKYPVDKIIQDARKEREKLMENEDNVRFQALCDLRADWEKSSDRRIQLNTVKRRLDTSKRIMQIGLEERRDKLRALLASEEAELSCQMEESQETVLERQAKLRDRARQLKEQKEQERQAIAAEKYEQLFRSQCEELRSTVSRRMQDEIAAERFEQIKLKKVLEQEKQQEDAFFAQLWEEEQRKKAEREERDVQAKIARDREQVEVLEMQRAALREQKLEEQRLRQEEEALLQEMAALRKLEEQRELEAKRRAQEEARELFTTSVKLKLKRKAREVQEELAFDMKILEQLVEQSRNEAIEDARRKHQLRIEDQRYREYLQQAKAAEAAKEKELERLLDEEVARQWKKRVEQWEREKAAREEMMRQVIAERKEQIQQRVLANECRKREAEAEQEKIRLHIEENRLRAEQKEAAAEQRLRDHQHDLLGQIAYNQRLRDQEEAEEKRQEAAMSAAEAEYQRRLKDALEKDWVDPKMHPMRRRHMMLQSGKL